MARLRPKVSRRVRIWEAATGGGCGEAAAAGSGGGEFDWLGSLQRGMGQVHSTAGIVLRPLEAAGMPSLAQPTTSPLAYKVQKARQHGGMRDGLELATECSTHGRSQKQLQKRAPSEAQSRQLGLQNRSAACNLRHPPFRRLYRSSSQSATHTQSRPRQPSKQARLPSLCTAFRRLLRTSLQQLSPPSWPRVLPRQVSLLSSHRQQLPARAAAGGEPNTPYQVSRVPQTCQQTLLRQFNFADSAGCPPAVCRRRLRRWQPARC